jgi:hypothetical protein
MTSEGAVHSSTLRLAFNSYEYELLRHYLIRILRRDSQRNSLKAEAPWKSDSVRDSHHAAAIRSSLRVFLGTAAGLKAWEAFSTFFLARGTPQG